MDMEAKAGSLDLEFTDSVARTFNVVDVKVHFAWTRPKCERPNRILQYLQKRLLSDGLLKHI
jgi:hypothetical protein